MRRGTRSRDIKHFNAQRHFQELALSRGRRWGKAERLAHGRVSALLARRRQSQATRKWVQGPAERKRARPPRPGAGGGRRGVAAGAVRGRSRAGPPARLRRLGPPQRKARTGRNRRASGAARGKGRDGFVVPAGPRAAEHDVRRRSRAPKLVRYWSMTVIPGTGGAGRPSRPRTGRPTPATPRWRPSRRPVRKLTRSAGRLSTEARATAHLPSRRRRARRSIRLSVALKCSPAAGQLGSRRQTTAGRGKPAHLPPVTMTFA